MAWPPAVLISMPGPATINKWPEIMIKKLPRLVSRAGSLLTAVHPVSSGNTPSLFNPGFAHSARIPANPLKLDPLD